MSQIVINIPDETYDWFKNGFPDEKDGEKAIEYILNGKELAKGHGRLIDADALRDTYARAGLVGYDEEIQAIDDSPTVIEADKEIIETAEEIVLRQARIGDELAKGFRAGLIEGLNGSSL